MNKLLLILLLNITFLFAQKEVSGFVLDNAGAALSGVNVLERGTNNGTSTDINGAYTINVKEGAVLIFSYYGFLKQEKETTESILNVFLSQEGQENLDAVIVTGIRTVPRSSITTALPIDVLSFNDLKETGQITLDKALQYKIPSFNTSQIPSANTSTFLAPYELRNMGSSRTLILVNGKRKNGSALLPLLVVVGRGETSVDLSAISIAAIERIEILRDGASAQYGSDAIAGVINVILKKNTNTSTATATSGITSKGDGAFIGVTINNGSTINNKGFINYTLDFSKENLANRPGKIDAIADTATYQTSLASVQSFLTKYPYGKMIIGSPETAAAKFLINGENDLSDETKLYYNAAYVYKKVTFFGFYRTPYWKKLDPDNPYLADFFGDGTPKSYQGYLPKDIGNLIDYNATTGFKNSKNGWNTDVSITLGGNSQSYRAENTLNDSPIVDENGINVYRENSPISFNPGEVTFNHIVGNIDISKVFSDKVSIGFGTEFRTENFEIIEGDKPSWDGSGADAFVGNRPEDSGKWNRYNLGGYLDLVYDFNKDFLINATVRFENYSDFGTAMVGKLSTRYKFLNDKVTLRGSLSTGFRAPTLQQIYTQKSQFTFGQDNAGQISVIKIINNISPEARILGIPKLDAEKSTNISVGIGAKPNKNLNLTLDYYNITVKDRIVLGDIKDTELGKVYWFENSFDSRTSGLDLVINYTNIQVGKGELELNLSGNLTLENKRISAVASDNFGAILNANTFTSRPKQKLILAANYHIQNINLFLSNTYFGKAIYLPLDNNPNVNRVFIPKIVTDLGINFPLTNQLSIAATVNNLLNVIPEWKFKSLTDMGKAILNDPEQTKALYNTSTINGRYLGNARHFSQFGTLFNLSLSYKF